jgi:hypothetical protein
MYKIMNKHAIGHQVLHKRKGSKGWKQSLLIYGNKTEYYFEFILFTEQNESIDYGESLVLTT